MCICIYTSILVRTYTRVYIYILCISIYIYICIHIYIYIYIHTHAYIYVYIYIQLHSVYIYIHIILILYSQYDINISWYFMEIQWDFPIHCPSLWADCNESIGGKSHFLCFLFRGILPLINLTYSFEKWWFLLQLYLTIDHYSTYFFCCNTVVAYNRRETTKYGKDMWSYGCRMNVLNGS